MPSGARFDDFMRPSKSTRREKAPTIPFQYGLAIVSRFLESSRRPGRLTIRVMSASWDKKEEKPDTGSSWDARAPSANRLSTELDAEDRDADPDHFRSGPRPRGLPRSLHEFYYRYLLGTILLPLGEKGKLPRGGS
ncbi:hypothetical protein NL676_028276 [Syzygium grande]|nr:hypothetical protein NL676_028276 [Syzygium grande]